TTALPSPAPGVVPTPLAGWDPGSYAFQNTPRQAVQLPAVDGGTSLAPVMPANNFSISIWFKASVSDLDTNGSELVSLGDYYILRIGKVSTTGVRLEFNKYVVTTKVYVQCWNTAQLDAGTPPFLDGGWHHVVAEASSVAPGSQLYLDGSPIPCTT